MNPQQYSAETREAVVWELSMLIEIFQGMADAAGPNVGAEMARFVIPPLIARRQIVMGQRATGRVE